MSCLTPLQKLEREQIEKMPSKYDFRDDDSLGFFGGSEERIERGTRTSATSYEKKTLINRKKDSLSPCTECSPNTYNSHSGRQGPRSLKLVVATECELLRWRKINSRKYKVG
ncbi:hypothetical protein E2C01_079746 [Portunus trituberculatus]|uniref:Uncharacterized protein n=1 Tax=Portunus trituberculatus TaxID=210409 RepID=A0A5B7IWF4_PORTR|nr:hypothetical protein [Portunus trituberculatus]